jgi:hypothetical protein
MKKIRKFFQNLPSLYLFGLIIIVVWEIFIIFGNYYWTNIILLPAGAAVGYLLLELDWPFMKSKELKKILPFILLPVTLFIITSTTGVLGKAVVVFLNLRLLFDPTKK